MNKLKYFKKYFFVLLILSSIIACHQHDHEGEKLLEKAGKIHDQAVAIEKEVKASLEKVETAKAQLQEKIEQTEEETAKKALVKLSTALNDIEQSYNYWKEAVVEVPGHEHAHDHSDGEHHHHEHGAKDNSSPAQHLELQKELKANIEKVKTNIETTLEKVEAALK